MKSTKFIEWEEQFCLGHTIKLVLPFRFEVMEVHEITGIRLPVEQYKRVTFNHQFFTAPCNIDSAIHKANRIFKYYTMKQLPGAVIILGSK